MSSGLTFFLFAVQISICGTTFVNQPGLEQTFVIGQLLGCRVGAYPLKIVNEPVTTNPGENWLVEIAAKRSTAVVTCSIDMALLGATSAVA